MALAEQQIALVNWERLRVLNGSAGDVGRALSDLLAAKSVDDVERAYWRLENHVVAQGTVYEAAAEVCRVVVAALVEERPSHVKYALLDLLFQILSGAPDPSEAEHGSADLMDRCRERSREGLWTLIREAQGGTGGAARDVLELIDAGHFEQLLPDA